MQMLSHMLKTRQGLTLSLLSAAAAVACAGGVYAAAGGINTNTATTIYDPITLQPITSTTTGSTAPNSIGGNTGSGASAGVGISIGGDAVNRPPTRNPFRPPVRSPFIPGPPF